MLVIQDVQLLTLFAQVLQGDTQRAHVLLMPT